MWNIALHTARTNVRVRSVKVRTITPEILLLAMQREADASELDALLRELADIAESSGDLPVLAGERLDFGDDAEDEPTMPFIAPVLNPL
jgi:hypothetical protein